MTTQEKTHIVELSEGEMAAILFLLYKANGIPTHRVWKRCREILGTNIDYGDFHDKHKSLSKVNGHQDLVDYYSVQEEWEAFLLNGCKNEEVLDKIAKMERELAELKEML